MTVLTFLTVSPPNGQYGQYGHVIFYYLLPNAIVSCSWILLVICYPLPRVLPMRKPTVSYTHHDGSFVQAPSLAILRSTG